MRLDNRAGKLCVILCNPGPAAAAIFAERNGQVTRTKSWLRGPRPSWVWRASRNLQTLVIDSALPTLASSAQNMDSAREKLTRIGLGETSLLSSCSGCIVAIRESHVAQLAESSLESGILTDYTTSLSALELAIFLKETQTADGAKLSFHENAAILCVRENERISVRRFALPAMTAELTSTLNLYAGPLLVIDGILAIEGFVIEKRTNRTQRDIRIADVNAVNADTLSKAADLYFAGELAFFEAKHQRIKNVARRWLPPLSAALAILCLAAIAPLADSVAQEHAQNERLSQISARKAKADELAESNRETLARIQKLSSERNALINGMMSTQKTLGSIITIQEAKRAARQLQLDTIDISHGGEKLTISGSLPAGYGDELGTFVDKLGKANFKPTSDLSMHEGNERLAFSVNMEERR